MQYAHSTKYFNYLKMNFTRGIIKLIIYKINYINESTLIFQEKKQNEFFLSINL